MKRLATLAALSISLVAAAPADAATIRDCGNVDGWDVWAGNATCSFARNVARRALYSSRGYRRVRAWSPAARRHFVMHCRYLEWTDSTYACAGNGAKVWFE